MELYYATKNNYLAHHGIKGQKWGVIRYQNKNGGLTSTGNKRYSKETSNETQKKSRLSDRQKKAIKVGAAVAGTALAAYGTYKLAKYAQHVRTNRAAAKSAKYFTDHYLEQFGETKIKNGTTVRSLGYGGKGKNVYKKTISGMSDKELKRYNQYVTTKSAKIFEDATNTKFDKGVSKIVDAGDAVGRRTRKVSRAINNASRKVTRG